MVTEIIKPCRCGKESTIVASHSWRGKCSITYYCRECFRDWLNKYRLENPLSKENIESRKPPPLF